MVARPVLSRYACAVPNSYVAPDLLLYARCLCLSVSSTCSWSGCSAGWCCWRAVMPSRMRRSWCSGVRRAPGGPPPRPALPPPPPPPRPPPRPRRPGGGRPPPPPRGGRPLLFFPPPPPPPAHPPRPPRAGPGCRRFALPFSPPLGAAGGGPLVGPPRRAFLILGARPFFASSAPPRGGLFFSRLPSEPPPNRVPAGTARPGPPPAPDQ